MSIIFFSGGKSRFAIEADDRQRLTNALGPLLQVNQLCVLVGSGASFHLGSPRIRSVTASQVSEMCASASMDLSEEAERLLTNLAPGSVDLEALLAKFTSARSYADAFNLSSIEIAGNMAARELVNELYESVNVALASACDLPHEGVAPPFDVDPWLAHRELFRRILAARRPDAPRVKVFTTNYDTVIEQALDDSGISYIDGFVGGVTRTLDLASYATDLFSTSYAGRPVRAVHDLIHLYKLHGSLTWRVVSSQGRLSASRIVQASGPPRRGQLAVIYPTPTKESDVVGHPYADLLREFGVSLSVPECALLVLGYGFADEHINRLVYQALSFNSTLQVMVVDPYGVVEDDSLPPPEQQLTDSPVASLAGAEDARISVITGDGATFPDFVRCLPDIGGGEDGASRSPDEALAKALLRTHHAN